MTETMSLTPQMIAVLGNALVMEPGGYHVKDFLRAGSIMSVIFVIVTLVMLNIIY
jgi:di/tricarboxylate transporter